MVTDEKTKAWLQTASLVSNADNLNNEDDSSSQEMGHLQMRIRHLETFTS